MARTIDQINSANVAVLQANATLGPLLTSTSKTAVWRLFVYIFSVCQWTIENIVDQHKAEVKKIIKEEKVHKEQWYAQIAKEFQYGFDLQEDDTYDNTGVSDADLAASRVIHYVAVKQQGKKMRVKVATTIGNDLGEVPGDVLAAFEAYMNKRKDAGVRLLITTGPADGLKLTIDFYINALVLNVQGQRLDGTTNTPCQDAINEYLKNLPFNGVFALQSLGNVLESVEGVKLVNIKFAASQYGALAYTGFPVFVVPDSGYLRIITPNDDLVLNFIPYSE